MNKPKFTPAMLVKAGITLLFIGGFCYFFYSEFKANLDQILESRLETNILLLIVSIFPSIAAYLLVTAAWRHSLIHLAGQSLGWLDSIAILNIPAMAKYIPGKVWSYAIQMYWLDKHGFSKSIVLYNNILNVGISILVSAILGLIYFVFKSGQIPHDHALIYLCILLAANLVFIIFEHQFIKFGIQLINRFTKRELKFFKTPKIILVALQFYFVGIYFLFGLGAWVLAKGIGFPLPVANIIDISVAFAVADSIGFLVLIVPGGLGVREGVMYSILNQLGSKGMALMLPIASRVNIMIAEALIFGFSFLYLKSKKKN